MSAPAEDRISEKQVVATSSNAWSGNSRIKNGWIVGIRSSPATASTVYDLRLVDGDSYDIYRRQGIKGGYSDAFIGIGSRSLVTVYIENATADEAFELKLIWQGL